MVNYKPDENYNGKTKLRNWWPVIKKNIAWVVEIINDHVNGTADRHSAEQIDYDVSQTVKVKIDEETKERQQGDTALQTNINTEAQTRKNADDTLRADLEAEEIARTDTDTELSGRIGDLTKKG